ncbi:MAG: ABC transporter substrate-binding protein [Clostridiales bacterium]|nr:ABC transporter substrate-binding protein [Clostridiales bacterium]
MLAAAALAACNGGGNSPPAATSSTASAAATESTEATAASQAQEGEPPAAEGGAASAADEGGAAAEPSGQTAQATQEAQAGEELEPVTLRLFLREPAMPDDAMVAEYVSNLPEVKALNATIEFAKYPGWNEVHEKLPLLLASDEPMDIGFDAGGSWTYVPHAQVHAYLDITDMLDAVAPKLKAAIPDAFWEGARINDGRIYGVPTYKEIGEQPALWAEKEFLDKHGIDSGAIKSLGDAAAILEALESEPERAKFMANKNYDFSMLDGAQYLYDVIGSMTWVSRGDGKTVTSWYMTPEYEAFVRKMREWYNKGWISSDVATRETYNEYITEGAHLYGLSFTGYAPLQEIGNSSNYGKELVYMPVGPVKVTNNSTRGSIFVIFRKSEHPERALQFLEVWNTVPEVKNAIAFGLEGRHYNLVDGQVQAIEGSGDLYWCQNWTSGNNMISYTLVGEPKDKWQQYEAWNDTAVNSVCLGFTPDDSAISDKLAACAAVVSEYHPLLECGAIDPEENLPKFIQALKDAGVEDIIAEHQLQFDAWK